MTGIKPPPPTTVCEFCREPGWVFPVDEGTVATVWKIEYPLEPFVFQVDACLAHLHLIVTKRLYQRGWGKVL